MAATHHKRAPQRRRQRIGALHVRPFAVIAGIAFVHALPISAHHSVLSFDRATFVELEGIVEQLSWRNPHVMLTLGVDGDDGRRQSWEIEGDSLNALLRRGITREMLEPGTALRIAGWPSLFGRPEVYGINVLLPSGDELIMADETFPRRWTDDEPTAAAVSAGELGRSLFRTWTFGRFYAPSAPFVYTGSAAAARAAWDPYTDMLAIRCVPPGMPNAMLNPYPIAFVDEGERIRLHIEEWEAVRTIDMTSPAVPADAPRSRLGYSTGRWECRTLVIDTANVDFPYLDDEGTPLGQSARMIERFTVSEDGLDLEYEITVSDPENLVEPAVWDAAWRWVPGTEIRPFECDP